jgi:hypothetical protein
MDEAEGDAVYDPGLPVTTPTCSIILALGANRKDSAW